ncbi:hypothetical protein M9Y10_021876 [Tritrichomonas musculus]|uniref:Ubiquitin-like domain-containing protein n=1 Tax=Tritrichomonas musculus TaxID=1915356 RepID=A0ABR2KQM1_9EUKA
MNNLIVIRAQWTWGDSKIIKTLDTNVIGDVLTEEGFEEISGNRLIIVCNGKILEPYFTFAHYSIKNGMKLVMALKKLPTKDRSRKFLESLNMNKQNAVSFPQTQQNENSQAEVARMEEIARLTDLAYSTWEALPDCNLIMNEILSSQQEQAQEYIYEEEPIPTDITKADQIQEDPLPNFLDDLRVSSSGTLKSEISFSSGLLPDTRSGNAGICQKKH